MSIRLAVTCVALTVVALSGCFGEDGGKDGSSSPRSDGYENPPMHARVEITQNGYRPKDVRILVGGTVTFVNVDKTESNTAETGNLPDGPSDNNEFDTHSLSWEEPYTVTFHKPEKVGYYNALEAGMFGSVEAVRKVDTSE